MLDMHCVSQRYESSIKLDDAHGYINLTDHTLRYNYNEYNVLGVLLRKFDI